MSCIGLGNKCNSLPMTLIRSIIPPRGRYYIYTLKSVLEAVMTKTPLAQCCGFNASDHRLKVYLVYWDIPTIRTCNPSIIKY